MIIRPENIRDYADIAQLNYAAFAGWHPDRLSVHEPELVALARQSRLFDPELSLVAERNGEIIGHVLLLPSDFIVMGAVVKGVLLGPIAVLPSCQKSGIGKKLIEKGHQAAKEKGYAFSLLCGHPEYYPRFGYRQNVFSMDGTRIEVKKPRSPGPHISERQLSLQDVSLIHQWQTRIRGNDSLAILFDAHVMAYHAQAPRIKSAVITRDSVPIAYVKYPAASPHHLQTLFYRENELDSILHYLVGRSPDGTLIIQQPCDHFDRGLPQEYFNVSDQRKPDPAFMLCPLSQNHPIHHYCGKVSKQEIPLGVISYPPYCDMDD